MRSSSRARSSCSRCNRRAARACIQRRKKPGFRTFFLTGSSSSSPGRALGAAQQRSLPNSPAADLTAQPAATWRRTTSRSSQRLVRGPPPSSRAASCWLNTRVVIPGSRLLPGWPRERPWRGASGAIRCVLVHGEVVHRARLPGAGQVVRAGEDPDLKPLRRLAGVARLGCIGPALASGDRDGVADRVHARDGLLALVVGVPYIEFPYGRAAEATIGLRARRGRGCGPSASRATTRRAGPGTRASAPVARAWCRPRRRRRCQSPAYRCSRQGSPYSW